MEGEREKSRDQQDNQDISSQAGQGSEPPRSMGIGRGTEFGHPAERGNEGQQGQQGQSGTGQADLGSQAGSTLAGHTEQEDLGPLGGEIDQPGSYAGGTSGRQSEPFIAREGGSTDENLVERETQGFAPEGQGAPAESEDVETGQPARQQNRASDIEGSSDKS